MRWTFKLRDKTVTLTAVEGVMAIQPTPQLRSRASASEMVKKFGAAAKDDTRGGFGLTLPARNRKVFERAGWLFVEPAASVARAAAKRAAVPSAETVQNVFVNRSGELLVGTDLVTIQLVDDVDDAAARAAIKEDGLRMVRRLKFAPNAFEARVTGRKPYLETLHQLQQNTRRYRFAEPALLQALTGRRRPTDPLYDRQWQHSNDGSNGGTAGADLHSEAAWDLTLGRGPTRSMRIAVIDNGMQVNHPDLRDGIVGGGHFEDDGQGGATFVRFQSGATGFPDENHGTFCMGMAGARIDNDRGGCGSAPEADLLAIACLPDQVGTQTTLARAVAYAADPSREDGSASPADGADVIACSLGPNGADFDLTSVLDLAIQFAASQGREGLGTPILWAVSNGSFEVRFDEVCFHPDVIAVGRSNRNDLEDGSAFGPKLEFLAPGRDVFSTRSGSQYGFSTGTSFAAPLAAGVAALALARHPTWTRDELRQRLRESCDKVGGVVYDATGHHDDYGFGRLNAERAVQ